MTMPSQTNEQELAETQIRSMIERWAESVKACDLDAVLAHRSDDIVMFDVPPPSDGIRGIDEYRDSWPPFFEWQRENRCFDIVELQVTAGADVAYAHALLKCASADTLADNPRHRLRLTVCLCLRDGEWIVTHEHHSFPDYSVGSDPTSL
jgi:ketosteroid isomerase-like protein